MTIQHAFLSVLPKSGYFSLKTFINLYCANLQHHGAQADRALHKLCKDLFQKINFAIGHNECPGFIEADPYLLNLWQRLTYNNAVPWIMKKPCNEYINKVIASGDTAELRKCRIVYIYRNPLDQILSHFKYMKNYPADAKIYEKHQDPYKDFPEFIAVGISGYIKNFYTYYKMQQLYPDLIVMISYEEMMRNRAVVLRRILELLEIPYHEAAFLKAEYESSLEVQAPKMPLHIHNGGIGVWQDVMTPEMVLCIEDQLQDFGLSLRMFTLADTFKPEFKFLANTKSEFKTIKYAAAPRVI